LLNNRDSDFTVVMIEINYSVAVKDILFRPAVTS
jgi:hypothetical protein